MSDEGQWVGEVVNFEFLPNSEFNGVVPPVGEASRVVLSINANPQGGEILNINVIEQVGHNFQTLLLSLQDPNGLQTQTRYDPISSTNKCGATVMLADHEIGNGHHQFKKVWEHTGTTKGSAYLTRFEADQVEIAFNFTGVTAKHEEDFGSAEGGFDFSGVATFRKGYPLDRPSSPPTAPPS